jgi:hypothetical protein
MAKLEKADNIKNYGKIVAIIIFGYLTFSLFRITTLYNNQMVENVVHDIKSQLSINFNSN